MCLLNVKNTDRGFFFSNSFFHSISGDKLNDQRPHGHSHFSLRFTTSLKILCQLVFGFDPPVENHAPRIIYMYNTIRLRNWRCINVVIVLGKVSVICIFFLGLFVYCYEIMVVFKARHWWRMGKNIELWNYPYALSVFWHFEFLCKNPTFYLIKPNSSIHSLHISKNLSRQMWTLCLAF